ncbi:hypothetical protein AKJ50_00330 [candidate division MSBL1 archaeon SCGC-AAA382A13]|uniref:Uncharacterized protein n=1 Tax=candidate division MSBL1 archaeon SCGC-AAA382A13 TaxID=1698279 RepID=A0A133VGT2_9EURY|nr:hypothetical protein AKJ50_00330 [candidate division MSBL1 archaeon SCGC-AAA382A13]
MDKKDFFEDWKKDWEERKKELDTDQAEFFRKIRDRKNLEKRLERRMEKVIKEMAEGISEEVYPLKERKRA